MRNPLYPGIVTLMFGVRVSNFKLDPIGGIEKHLMVKLVTIGVHTRNNIEIIFLELVGDLVASVSNSFRQKLSNSRPRDRSA